VLHTQQLSIFVSTSIEDLFFLLNVLALKLAVSALVFISRLSVHIYILMSVYIYVSMYIYINYIYMADIITARN